MAARLADGVEHDEVVLAAGRDAVDDHVGDRHVRCGERLFGLGLLGLGGLDLLGELLGVRQQRGPLVGAMPCPPACWRPSARRAGCRRPRSRPGARRRRRAARRRGQGPRHGRVATRAPQSGSSRSSLRSITAATLLLAGSGQTSIDARHGRGRLARAQPHNITTASLVTAPDTPVTMEPMLEAPEREPLLADEADSRRSGWRGGRACRPRRRAARCC